MLKAIFRNSKAATVAEFATFLSLTFTLCLVLFIGFNGSSRSFYPEEARDPELLGDRITENCLVRTRANDTVVPRQAEPYNCFKLGEGNDRITLAKGDNIVYPGDGRNVIIIQAGARDTQVVYEGGDDVLHFSGGRSILDLRKFDRDEVSFDILRKSPSTIEVGGIFDPDNRPAVDLLIRTPDGMIIVADHFNNKSVSMVVFDDARLYADEIPQQAISDQQTERNDHILATNALDVVSPGAGNDRVELFEGDDIITYTSGDDRYDAGPGRDVLELPGFARSDLKFSISEDSRDILVKTSKGGSITLIDQALYAPSSQRVQFAKIQLDDLMMRDSAIMEAAIIDQGTPGDDTIFGSIYSDIIHPGTGQNKIYPGLGSDRIVHEGGDDIIYALDEDTVGTDILDLSTHARSSLSFTRGDGDDLIIRTEHGSTITVKDQFSKPAGSPGTNIEVFRMKGEEMRDDIMRKLFFSAPAPVEN